MVEGRTGIPETGKPKSIVIDFQAKRQQRLSEGRPGGAAQQQTETPHQERGQEPNVAVSTAAMPISVPAEQNHLPHEPKDNLIDLNQSTGDSYTRRRRHVDTTRSHVPPSVPMSCGSI